MIGRQIKPSVVSLYVMSLYIPQHLDDQEQMVHQRYMEDCGKRVSSQGFLSFNATAPFVYYELFGFSGNLDKVDKEG